MAEGSGALVSTDTDLLPKCRCVYGIGEATLGRMTDLLIPFGLDREGVIRNAYEVLRGGACGCQCPVCGAGLIARQGEKIAWHFAHASGHTGGSSCGESMTHRMAKRILFESNGKVLHLPEPFGTDARKHYFCRISRVKLEYPVGSRSVDAFAKTVIRGWDPDRGAVHWPGGPLAIEICVTNAKDAAYKVDMERFGISVVEITIQRDALFAEIAKRQGTGISALRRLVLGPRTANRHWLVYNQSILGKPRT